jgi:hypothetical protein
MLVRYCDDAFDPATQQGYECLLVIHFLLVSHIVVVFYLLLCMPATYVPVKHGLVPLELAGDAATNRR